LAGKRSGTLKLAFACSAPSDAKPRRRTGSPFSSRGRRAGALLLSSFEIGASVCVGELLVWCRGGWPRFSEDHDRRNRTKACNEEQGEHAQERLPVPGCYGGHMRRQGAACGTDVLITQSVSTSVVVAGNANALNRFAEHL